MVLKGKRDTGSAEELVLRADLRASGKTTDACWLIKAGETVRVEVSIVHAESTLRVLVLERRRDESYQQ